MKSVDLYSLRKALYETTYGRGSTIEIKACSYARKFYEVIRKLDLDNDDILLIENLSEEEKNLVEKCLKEIDKYIDMSDYIDDDKDY